MMDIGKQTVKIDCPDCKRQISVSLNQISRQALIRCSCGQAIQLKGGANNQKVINDINRSFKDLENAFKKLGR